MICLEYPIKHSWLHQGLIYIVYLGYCIDFYFITVVLKDYISIWMFFLLEAEEIFLGYHSQKLGVNKNTFVAENYIKQVYSCYFFAYSYMVSSN